MPYQRIQRYLPPTLFHTAKAFFATLLLFCLYAEPTLGQADLIAVLTTLLCHVVGILHVRLATIEEQ